MTTQFRTDPGTGESDHPVRRQLHTSDPERAHDFIRSCYADHKTRISGSGADFNFYAATAVSGPCAIGRIDYTMGVDAAIDPPDFVAVAQVLAGQYEYVTGEEEHQVAHGEVFLCPAGAAHTTRWRDINLGVVRLDMNAIEDSAAGLTGVPAASLRFEPAHPISAMHARYWRATVHHVARDVFPNPQAMASSLIREQLVQDFTAALLHCFPNNAHDAGEEPGNIAPAAVRRAVDYIEQNSTSPLSLAEVAAAARIGPRSLQAAFRRYLDTTPSAYIRLLRLQGAHRDLCAADPTRGETVAGIAARWGFSHHGRFAHSYQRSYGRAPRHTLHEHYS